jgi:hypothetical protein
VSLTVGMNASVVEAAAMVIWLAWAIVVGLVLWLGPEPRRRHRAEVTERVTTVQILFAERENDVLAVDCVLLEPLRSNPSGTLLSLHLEPPSNRELQVAACNAISDWASSGSVVKLHLITRDGAPVAKIDDARTTLQLDLEAAVA